MSDVETLDKSLNNHIENYKLEFHKFNVKGNKTACKRCRKHLIEMAKLCKELRKACTVQCKSLPKKKRKINKTSKKEVKKVTSKKTNKK